MDEFKEAFEGLEKRVDAFLLQEIEEPRKLEVKWPKKLVYKIAGFFGKDLYSSALQKHTSEARKLKQDIQKYRQESSLKEENSRTLNQLQVESSIYAVFCSVLAQEIKEIDNYQSALKEKEAETKKMFGEQRNKTSPRPLDEAELYGCQKEWDGLCHNAHQELKKMEEIKTILGDKLIAYDRLNRITNSLIYLKKGCHQQKNLDDKLSLEKLN